VAISPSQQPDDNSTAAGATVAGTDARRAWSGTPAHDSDPTNMEGQYPPGSWGTAIFGGPQPVGTGAPGTQGARWNRQADPTNEPGQVTEGLTGIGPPDTTQTGAPGAATTPNTEGGNTAITATQPGSFLSGSYKSDSFRDDTYGSRDSTQANDEGYASGGPKLPGMFEPAAGGGPAAFQPEGTNAGSGHVMRGGRAIRP
jgi:hypothetical protein